MHTQKLESLGALCGGIPHEFNNILVGVLGNADYLRLRISSDIKEQKNISGIIESAQRASQLVQQMLLYSGRREIEKGWLNRNELIQEMKSVLKATVSKKIKIDYSLSGSIRNCLADGSQLRQALTNLVMSGEEVLVAIRKSSKTIPVLICSGYSDTDFDNSIKHDSYTTLLSKPFQRLDLELRLADVLA